MNEMAGREKKNLLVERKRSTTHTHTHNICPTHDYGNKRFIATINSPNLKNIMEVGDNCYL